MANTINPGTFNPYLKSAGIPGSRPAGAGKGKNARGAKEAKDFLSRYGGGADVGFSSEGLAALAAHRKKAVDSARNDGTVAGEGTKESKLSAKAQDFLEKLREKYKDYDFIVAERIDDPLGMAKGSTKEYSVLLTNDELEKMANDEEYAQGVMDKIDSAVAMTKRIEDSGALGEGVSFKHVVISFDAEGKMKMFAELERMTEEQQERLKAAQEKRAEERRQAAKAPPKEKETGKVASDGKEKEAPTISVVKMPSRLTPEQPGRDLHGRPGEMPPPPPHHGAGRPEPFAPVLRQGPERMNHEPTQRVWLEATSEEDFMEQLQSLDWDEVAAKRPDGPPPRLDHPILA